VQDSNETWVMHITAIDPKFDSVWVAQRVPDGHFVVVPNTFVIREVNFTDTDNFKWSSNLKIAAMAMKK